MKNKTIFVKCSLPALIFVNSLATFGFNINRDTNSTSEIQGRNLSRYLYENKDTKAVTGNESKN